MSIPNLSIVEVQYQNRDKRYDHESIVLSQQQEVIEQKSRQNILENNKTINVSEEATVTKETVIDVEILKLSAIPKNTLSYTSVILQKLRYSHKKLQNIYQGYPRHTRPIKSNKPYPPHGNKPQGYSPHGYLLQGYPPQAYPNEGCPPQGGPVLDNHVHAQDGNPVQYYPRQDYPPGYPPQSPKQGSQWQGYPQGHQQQGFSPGYSPQGSQHGYPPRGPPQDDRFPGQPPERPDNGDIDETEAEEEISYDPETRNPFIRTVMLLVLMMLIITTVIIGYAIYTPQIHYIVNKNSGFIFLPLIGLIICNCAIYSDTIRRTPLCYIVLVFAIMFMSLFALFVSCRAKTQVVVHAGIATTGVVFVCLLLACTSFDFTKRMLYIIVIGVALSIVALLLMLGAMIFQVYIPLLHMGILVLFVIYQSVMLVMEMQLVLGGRVVELAENEHALAAFMIYTSIVHIFILFVQILGGAES